MTDNPDGYTRWWTESPFDWTSHGDAELAALGLVLAALQDDPLRLEGRRYGGIVDLVTERTGMSAAVADGLIRRMARFGIVERVGVKAQRRVRLTELGRRWLDSDEGQTVQRSIAERRDTPAKNR